MALTRKNLYVKSNRLHGERFLDIFLSLHEIIFWQGLDYVSQKLCTCSFEHSLLATKERTHPLRTKQSMNQETKRSKRYFCILMLFRFGRVVSQFHCNIILTLPLVKM